MMEESRATGPDWGEESAGSSPKKKRIPSWVWWGCGGGCLFLTLIVIAVVIFATRLIRESTDPEKQWPRLSEVLAFDQRPAGIELQFGLGLGADQFHLLDEAKGLRATLIEYPSSASKDYEQLMDPDFELPMGLGKLIEPESGQLVVQGHEVPCLRFLRVQPGPEDKSGAGIRVDLSGSRKKPRTLELRRHGAAGRIEDAEVEAFLAPFDVWREP
jgi:hypothetical protein